MGRVGTCNNDAAMESFFVLLQKNVGGHEKVPTRGHA